MNVLLAIVLTGIGTYAMRAIFLITASKRTFSPTSLRMLEYVAPAVMGALVVSMLIDGTGNLQLGRPELAGLAMAALVAARTRNHILALSAAMTVFWLLRFI